MRPIDFTFRYDPSHPIGIPPANAEAARHLLESGNQLFAHWLESCRHPEVDPPDYVVNCHPHELGLASKEGEIAKQTPFAVVLGCSDARAPAEMIFAQARNNLFVIRLAGNVISDEGLGSVEYAIHNLDSIRILVVLGHSGCGAVTAAVDTYLQPWAYLEKISSHTLRSIVDPIFVPVRKSAKALTEIWGPDAAQNPNYREALVETAVWINAAQAAYDLRQGMLRANKPEIQVVFGVLDLLTHRVSAAAPSSGSRSGYITLADAPASLSEFEELAIRKAIRMTERTSRQ